MIFATGDWLFYFTIKPDCVDIDTGAALSNVVNCAFSVCHIVVNSFNGHPGDSTAIGAGNGSVGHGTAGWDVDAHAAKLHTQSSNSVLISIMLYSCIDNFG